MLYTSLGENLKNEGKYEAYSRVQDTLLVLKDLLYQKNSATAMASLQTRYDVQRKENIIIQKNFDIVKREYWLYAIVGIFAFLVVLFFILYQNYRKRQKLVMEKMLKEQQQRETIAILKAEEKERKRIAADLHDNLGAYAAAISANVKMLNDAGYENGTLTQQIEENVEGMVSQLGDTIWVLKKPNQLLTEVSDRFKVWLQRQMQNFPNVLYDVEEQITTDPMLTAACVLNLFYMLQECVNNAVRHSNCHQIIITLTASDEGLLITITDDGTGFEPENIKQGNGLENVKQRAADCNWYIAWKQGNENRGTCVFISDRPIG
jgi:signal transduction histidine kinase